MNTPPPVLLALLLALPLHAADGPEAGAAPAGETVEVPAATLMSVELVDPVSTGKNKAGDVFRARLLEGVYVRGAVAIPPNTTVRGTLTSVTPSGRVKGQSHLELTLRSMDLEGRTYAVHTDTLSYSGDPHAGKNVGSWLMGALQGAVYGVLFGGKSGAIIGAGAGAGAGGVSAVVNGKQEVEFRQGARLLFELSSPTAVPLFAPPRAPEPKAPAAAVPAAPAPAGSKPTT